jgi:hypothetical protein
MGLARCSADALDQALAYEGRAYAVAAVGRWHLLVLQALLQRTEEQVPDAALMDVIAAMSIGATYAGANEDGDFDGSHGYPPGDPRRQSPS